MEGALPGELAWYVTGRFYAAEDRSVRDAGYFVHLQGIDAELFSGPRGEGTAYLTFLADPFTARPLTNGDLAIGIDPAGEFAIYLNPQPAATFDDPATFGAGVEIARFRRTSIALGATVGRGEKDTGLITANVFSSRLISSRPFELGGRTYDLRSLLPNGVTQWGTASTTSTGAVDRYPTVIPFVGSAIAIGAR